MHCEMCIREFNVQSPSHWQSSFPAQLRGSLRKQGVATGRQFYQRIWKRISVSCRFCRSTSIQDSDNVHSGRLVSLLSALWPNQHNQYTLAVTSQITGCVQMLTKSSLTSQRSLAVLWHHTQRKLSPDVSSPTQQQGLHLPLRWRLDRRLSRPPGLASLRD